MTLLHALLPLVSLTFAAVPAGPVEVHQQGPDRERVVVDRPGMEPLVFDVSKDVLARNEMVGIWRVIYLERGGESRPESASQLHMRFTRGKIELMQLGCQTVTVAYDLDTKQYPRFFHWFEQSSGWLRQQKGLYWLEGDRLMMCMGSVNERRPSEFVTSPGDGRMLFVLERLEPPTGPALLNP